MKTKLTFNQLKKLVRESDDESVKRWQLKDEELISTQMIERELRKNESFQSYMEDLGDTIAEDVANNFVFRNSEPGKGIFPLSSSGKLEYIQQRIMEVAKRIVEDLKKQGYKLAKEYPNESRKTNINESISLKEIKDMVRYGDAIDITGYDNKECQELRDKGPISVLGVSRGVNGMNGALLKNNKTGELYAITKRTSALFIMV